jgi:hypothetical protein
MAVYGDYRLPVRVAGDVQTAELESMKQSEAGDRLWREYEIRVCLPEQRDLVWKEHCPSGRGWNADALEQIIERAGVEAERRWPSIEFRVVELAPNRIKFIYAGRKGNMGNVNVVPDVGKSEHVSKVLCAKDGHKIGSFPGGMQVGPQGAMPSYIQFCERCGFTLGEIRDSVEQMLNAHIGNEVNRRMAAAQQVNKPAGEPGEKIIDMPAPKPLAAAAAIPEE